MSNKFKISNFKSLVQRTISLWLKIHKTLGLYLAKRDPALQEKLEFGNWKFFPGVTIVELLLYMGIFSIVLTLLTAIFTQVIDVQLEADATSSVQLDGRYILSRLSYDVHRADSIVSPALGNQGSSMQLLIGGMTYTYSIDGGGNLVVADTTGTSYQLNSYNTTISNTIFRQVGNFAGGDNTIKITYTVTSKTMEDKGPKMRTFSTTVGLR